MIQNNQKLTNEEGKFTEAVSTIEDQFNKSAKNNNQKKKSSSRLQRFFQKKVSSPLNQDSTVVVELDQLQLKVEMDGNNDSLPSPHTTINLGQLTINPDFKPGQSRSLTEIMEEEKKLNKNFSKWKKLKNVLKGVILLRQLEVQHINNGKQLEQNYKGETYFQDDIKNCGKKETGSQFALRQAQKDKEKALIEQRDRAFFFEWIARANEKDLNEIIKYLQNDPKQYVLQSNDPERYTNKCNQQGQTPLYIACKNGHLSVVKILLNQMANPHLKSIIAKNQKEKESILEVSCRWAHWVLLDFLLDNIKWFQEELNSALKLCTNQQIKDKIKKKMKSAQKQGLTSCFCLSSKKH